jgi:hypothetical protein
VLKIRIRHGQPFPPGQEKPPLVFQMPRPDLLLLFSQLKFPFSDKTLIEMAVFPHSSDSLLDIYGVGAIKCKEFDRKKIKAVLNMNRTAIRFFYSVWSPALF